MIKQTYSVADIIHSFNNDLKDIYPAEEIKGFVRWSFQFVCGFSIIELTLKRNDILIENKTEALLVIIQKLKSNQPIQYILGETEFYGLKISVNENVLIPRPETEELVDWIIKENKKQKVSILDIGTGSGCIAIALKKNIQSSTIIAIDVSTEALNLAKENAILNNVDIDFRKVSILDKNEWKMLQDIDIIVSNPPYILEKEQTLMEKNVIEFEPHLALFVPDDDALLFYRSIVEFASEKLKPNGKIYFEINEEMGNAISNLLSDNNFKNIVIKKDLRGKDRMIKAEKG
jgi:release factor glutamine methyltransferase